MQLMLFGTGGCSAFDVVHILEKGREAVEDFFWGHHSVNLG